MKIFANHLNTKLDSVVFYAGKNRNLCCEVIWSGEAEDLIYDLVLLIEKGSYASMIASAAAKNAMSHGRLDSSYKRNANEACEEIKKIWSEIDRDFIKTFIA
jgi:hypothetical protein